MHTAVSGHPPWAALVGLTAAVLLAHALAVEGLIDAAPRLGEGAGAHMQRIEVAFVRELAPAEPPVVARAKPTAPPAGSRVAHAPAPAASAPRAKAAPKVEPEAPPEVVPPLPDVLAQAPSPPASQAELSPPLATPEVAAAEPVASAPAVAVAAPASATAASAAVPVAAPFEWPPSTRLSYRLTGNYRGPVEGSAQVEWLRSGSRYQVHLEVSIGPLLTRRMSSEGTLGERGLQPERYEEVTRALMRETRRQTLRFDSDQIVLAQGETVPRPPGVQDTASQFVQLTWLFTTRADLLVPGQVVEVPLALPRRVDRWIYDIQAQETLDTPAGRLATYHMKPRRSVPRPGELALESWFAPGLQYLPVRIVIRQDEQTWVDLTLSRAPQQAEAQPPVTGR